LQKEAHIVDRIRSLALLCARAADESKGENISLLDVRKVFFLTDYFVIGSGKNPKHLQAMADEVRMRMKEKDAIVRGMEGYGQGVWILIDFGDIVVHLLQKRLREFYELDHLWADARQVNWRRK
jgi:ribosome-associated protein